MYTETPITPDKVQVVDYRKVDAAIKTIGQTLSNPTTVATATELAAQHSRTGYAVRLPTDIKIRAEADAVCKAFQDVGWQGAQILKIEAQLSTFTLILSTEQVEATTDHNVTNFPRHRTA